MVSMAMRWAAGLVVLAATWARAGSVEADIRAVLADKALAKAQVGVVVARVTAGETRPAFVFQHNAEMPLIPASNLKVVTTSAALAVLGGDFRFRTVLTRSGNDLHVVGDGDPTLGDPELGEKIGWDYATVFRSWAGELRKAGITSVDNVYVDDSIFDRQFVHPNWPTDQLDEPYVAQVGGLNFHFNTIDIRARAGEGGITSSMTPKTSYVQLTTTARTGSKNAIGATRAQGTNRFEVRGELPRGGDETFLRTIHDPGLYGATVLVEVLREEGIEVKGGVGRSSGMRAKVAAGQLPVLASLETPLGVVLARCNKDSANLYAESLVKRVAAKGTGQPGSWAGARGVVSEWLTRIGVGGGQFTMDDGCGLSRGNRISAEAMVRILAYDFGAPTRDAMLRSMAVGGVDGTLRSRFEGDLRGRVFAKSGFIRGVSTLSGFVQTRGGQWYAFSILMNEVSGVKGLHERIVAAIDARTP
jgi:serine-type D-Ala-D-Ala carboxypeptidase/endopeptidase (penicillin-binding protein 4)